MKPRAWGNWRWALAVLGPLALIVACQAPLATGSAGPEGAPKPQFVLPAAVPEVSPELAHEALATKLGVNWSDGMFQNLPGVKALRQARGYRLAQAAVAPEWNVTLAMGTTSAPGYLHSGWGNDPNPSTGDRLFVLGTGGAGAAQVYSLNPTTGATVASWNVLAALGSTGTFANTAAVVSWDGLRLYVATTDGILGVISTADGSVLWSQKISNAGFNGIAPFVDYSAGTSPERVYITSRDGSLFRLDAPGYTLSAWPAYNDLDQPLHPTAPYIDYGGAVVMTSNPVVWGGRCWVGDQLGRMHRIDVSGGAPVLTTYQASGDSTVGSGAGRAITAPPAIDFDNALNVTHVFVPAGDRLAWITPSLPAQSAVRWTPPLAVDKTAPVIGELQSYAYSAPTVLGPYYANDHISVARNNPGGGQPQEWGAANSTNASWALENLPSRIARAPSGLFYIPSRGADAMTKFNPATGARTVIQNVTQQVFNAASGAYDVIRHSDGTYWVVNEGARQIIHYSALGATLATISTGATLQPRTICEGNGGRFWVACPTQNTILRYDATGTLEATIPTTHNAFAAGVNDPGLVRNNPVTGRAWYLGVSDNRVGIADLSGAGTPTANYATSLSSTARAVGINFNGAGQAWMGLSGANEIIRMLADGSVPVRQPVSATLTSYDFDPASNTHWVGLSTNQIRKWDLGFTTATNIALPARPTFTQVAPDGSAWSTLNAGSRVSRVTPAGVVTTAILTGTPTRLAIDSSNRAWVTCNNNTLYRIDAAMTVAGPFATDPAPIGVAFDATNRPWVACNTGASLQVFDPATGALVETYATTDTPHTPILDATGRPWVGTSTGDRMFRTPTATAYLDSPWGIETDGGTGVWVCNYNGRHLMHINSVGMPAGEVRTGDAPLYVKRSAAGTYLVTNYSSNNVARVSAAGAILATYAVGAQPWSLSYGPSGEAWVANRGANTVSRITAAGVVTTFAAPVGFTWNDPRFTAVDPAGNVWISMYGDDAMVQLDSAGTQLATKGLFGQTGPLGVVIDGSSEPWVVCNGTRKLVHLLLTGAFFSDPLDAVVDASGNVWVTNNTNNTVSKITSADVLDGTFPVGANPRGIDIDPSGNLWVANAGGNSISKLDSAGALVATYALGGGTNPYGVHCTADGRIWVACNGTAQVKILNGAGAITNTIAVGTQPTNLRYGPSGHVWVANYASNTVSRIHTGTLAVSSFSVGSGPIDMVEVPSNNEVWVSNRLGGRLTRLRPDGTVIDNYGVTTNIHGVQLNAAGTELFAVGESNDVIYRIAQLFPLDALAAATGYTTAGDGNDSKAFVRFSYTAGAFGRRLPLAARIDLSVSRSVTGNESYEVWPTDFLHPGTPSTLWRGFVSGGTKVTYASPPEQDAPASPAYTGPVVASDYVTGLPVVSLNLSERVPGDGPNLLGNNSTHYCSYGFRTVGKALVDSGRFYNSYSGNGVARPKLYVTVAGGGTYPTTHGMRAWAAIDATTRRVYGASTNAVWQSDYNSAVLWGDRGTTRFNLTTTGRNLGVISGGNYLLPRGNCLFTGDRLVVADYFPTGNRFAINSFRTPLTTSDRVLKSYDGGVNSGEVGSAMLYDFGQGSVYAATSTGRVVRVKVF